MPQRRGGPSSGGPSLGWSRIRVIPHQGGPSLGWSLARVVPHQGGPSLGWSLISLVPYHRWSLIRVVPHQGGPSSGWFFIRGVTHKGFECAWLFLCYPPSLPYEWLGGGGLLESLRPSGCVSVCPSVVLSVCPILSGRYFLNRSTILN